MDHKQGKKLKRFDRRPGIVNSSGHFPQETGKKKPPGREVSGCNCCF